VGNGSPNEVSVNGRKEGLPGEETTSIDSVTGKPIVVPDSATFGGMQRDLPPTPPPEKPRLYWSSPAPTGWESAGSWIDYRELRSWLRHPILTFLWWRQHGR
jgi:hypothetical protein